ncbi:hypothetical protein BG28_12755 [Nesterenkonia sp. AN1]|nr:hypothetical protein BG28_12755 [Nesterenkonia sp. AN1]
MDTIGALLGALAVLALLDSTSFGTLLIPVWLLMASGRLRAGRVLVYLAVVAGAYAVVGLILLTSLLLFGEQLIDGLVALQQSPVVLLGQAALGAGLIAYSFRLDPLSDAGRERKRRREEARGTSGRVQRFRERVVGEGTQGGLAPLMGLGLAAVGLEIATLLPYLAGIVLVAAADPGVPVAPAMILFYCAVMILPALVLLIARVFAHRALERPLRRLQGFLSRHVSGTVALILFLVGLWLGLNALGGLENAGWNVPLV